MAFVYILFSETLDRYYIGHTEMSPNDRLRKHLTDHDGFTAKAKDWKIVFSKAFDSKSDAYAQERKIKKWKSRALIEKLIKGA